MHRRVVTVVGIVQGVGFRPFVYALANRLGLAGSIRNQSGSVRIEIEGESAALDDFLRELTEHPPPLARIDRLQCEAAEARGERQFRIEPSQRDQSVVFVSPDVATCEACLEELFDPGDRRFRYPLLNCTNCGPRLTIITGAPYDRAQTTMAPFVMCAACRAEYEDPADRRFHAEPTACPTCGPQLELTIGDREVAAGEEPLSLFVEGLQEGRIGALKGLGGYHLVCDAENAAAVALLRERKQRWAKPLAVMPRDLPGALELCEANERERALLSSPRRPIVLLRKRPAIAIADEIAPGNPCLGLMLPYTPLHHLLLARMQGKPLVMTSGNLSDEPIAYEDGDAAQRLSGIADLILRHNRPIHVRCDDSVTRVADGQELPVRRSRGYAPEPISLPLPVTRPTLAVGGQLKNTFALARDTHAFLSHHIGDLDHLAAYLALGRDISLFEELFDVAPRRLVHDLHPEYASTRYARERAEREQLELVAVQHHHAHMASCMAECGLREQVIGVIFDGTGYGTDGAVWGGEFLLGDEHSFQRVAHIRNVRMPGGEQAIRQPWRMALAHLEDAGTDCPALISRLAPQELKTVAQMLRRGLNSPLTSSAGRLFDAVASLVGLRDTVQYEAQAAIELEWLAGDPAEERDAPQRYPFEIEEERNAGQLSPLIIDTRPLIRSVAEDVSSGCRREQIARRFHHTLVEIVTDVCCRLRRLVGCEVVVLSGGVFMNAWLIERAVSRLRSKGLRVYRHRRVPPNDGGLSLGQLAIAAARDQPTAER